VLIIYKILVNIAYVVLRPYFGSKRRRAPVEWNDRMALNFPRCSEITSDSTPAYGLCHFHASSVGELRVLRRLIDAVKRIRPAFDYCVSTYTRAGHDLALELFADAVSVFYFPLDCFFPLRRFFRTYRPRGVVIVETEIWPYYLDYCRKYNLPLVQANGRLSTGSARRYRLFRGTLRRLFAGYRVFLMQTGADAERMIDIGADADRVRVPGNIKHDVDSTIDLESKRAEVRAQLGLPDDTYLFIAASTRPGEEATICRALADVTAFPDGMTVLLAPRHLNRLDEVMTVLSERGFTFTLYSELEEGRPPPTAVILMDRIGALAELFYAADLAFVGGTLADIGGHNVMEPVLTGVPVLFGTSIYNVKEAAEKIIDGKLGMMIHDAVEMADCVNKVVDRELQFHRVESRAPSVADETARIIVQELGL
jgi:3-deoxy-D-manno-octulosonic-acid transferase